MGLFIVNSKDKDLALVYLSPQSHAGMFEESIFLCKDAPKGLGLNALNRFFSMVCSFYGKK